MFREGFTGSETIVFPRAPHTALSWRSSCLSLLVQEALLLNKDTKSRTIDWYFCLGPYNIDGYCVSDYFFERLKWSHIQ